MEPIQALDKQLEKMVYVGLPTSEQTKPLESMVCFFQSHAEQVPLFQRVVSALDILMDLSGSDQVRSKALTELTVLTHVLLMAQASSDPIPGSLTPLGAGVTATTPLEASVFTPVFGLSHQDPAWKNYFPQMLSLYGRLDFRLMGPAIALLKDQKLGSLACEYLMASDDNPVPLLQQRLQQGWLERDEAPWLNRLDEHFKEEGQKMQHRPEQLMAVLLKGNRPWMVQKVLEDKSEEMTALLLEEGKKALFQVTVLSAYDPEKTSDEILLPQQEWKQRKRLARVLYCLSNRQEEAVRDFLIECLKWVRYLAGIRFPLDVMMKNEPVDSAQQVTTLLRGVEDPRISHLMTKPWMPGWIAEEMKKK